MVDNGSVEPETLAYLRAHVPAGVTDRETDPQWNDYPVGRLLTLAYVASDNPGHTTPLLDLSVIATGSGQVLYRIQAATSWREANVLSALLQEVIRVDYEIVHLRPSDPTRTGAVTQGTLTDEASIRALTWWLGAAYGQPQYLGHCPYRGEARDSFVLTTAQGGRISVYLTYSFFTLLALLFFVPLVGWYAVRTRQEIRNRKPGASTFDSQPPREAR